MVDKVKKVGGETIRIVENALEVIQMAAVIAAAIKVASEPMVATGFRPLPIWQSVAAILLAWTAYKVFILQNKEK